MTKQRIREACKHCQWLTLECSECNRPTKPYCWKNAYYFECFGFNKCTKEQAKCHEESHVSFVERYCPTLLKGGYNPRFTERKCDSFHGKKGETWSQVFKEENDG